METPNETIETINEVVVLENTVLDTYKSKIEWITPEYTEINNYEKEMLKNSKNIETILNEESNETKPELTEEEQLKLKKKEYITKIKVVALDKMGKHPLMNPSYFKKKEKEELMSIMHVLLQQDEENITLLFNEICNERLFDANSDYSTFPIYKTLV